MAEESSFSSTRSGSPYSYDVFVSFRGQDTRRDLIVGLLGALEMAGFLTCRINEIDRGEDIRPEVLKAIYQSRCSIVVFSENYASSPWCLDELVMILECKRIYGHLVLPVFYKVEPFQVKNQIGSLATAIAKHEKRQPWDKVNGWRAALTEFADVGGMSFQNYGSEANLIQKIVTVIKDMLTRTFPINFGRNLPGMDSRVKDINLWLEDGYSDIHILVIYGMRGIGKTTIAKHVYQSNCERFEGSCFLGNMRETLEQHNGLAQILQKVISDILKKKVEACSTSTDALIRKCKDAMRSKRVLLVLDDLDDATVLHAILGMKESLYPGSKIIVTTTRRRLLHDLDQRIKVHSVAPLNYNESLELFCWHAFGQAHPTKGYMEYAERVVHHCHGLPFALEVLGSSLSGHIIPKWQSTLQELEAIPDASIMKILKTSFDSLQDHHDQDLFLHIACFFVGKDRDYIVKILDQCDFYTHIGIETLTERCLLTIDRDNKVQMHDLIRDMGREIVRLESEEPGKRSKLWRDEDSFNVLRKKTGTKTIQGLALNMHMYQERNSIRNSNEIVLETNAFGRMHKLRLLQLSHVHVNGCYEEFPKGLRWLCWLGFSSDSIPQDFSLNSLVVLEMQYSSLRRVWKGSKGRQIHLLLKILDLSHSHDLTEVGDLSLLPNLERLILKDCSNLVGIDDSIGMLGRLVYLNMEDCKNLRRFPKRMPEFLEVLEIKGCSNIGELTTAQISLMTNLKELDADAAQMNSLFSEAQESRLTVSDYTKFHINENLKMKIHVNLACWLRECEKCIELNLLQYLEMAIKRNLKLSRNKEFEKKSPKQISSGFQSLPESLEVADIYSAETTEKDHISGNDAKIVKNASLEENYGCVLKVAEEEDESLTEILKRSLILYCSLFPLDYEFRKNELVQLWIAEGFIVESHKERMEDTGILYFNSMENEGFFVPSRCDFEVDFDSAFSVPTYIPTNFLYKVNATEISLLGKEISEAGYFRAVDSKLDGACKTTQHLSLICGDINEITFGVLQKFERLRTLLLLSGCGSSIKHVPRTFFSSLKFLRTLNLSGTPISELPSAIRNAKELRYLDVSNTPITRLPEAVSSLQNLQTIKLRGCVSFIQLPKGLKKLTNLRHIELDIIRQLDSLPEYLGNLTNLQTLSAFLVGRDDGYRIGELKNLNYLKGALRISRLENVLTKEEATEAGLINKKCLQRVKFRWSNMLAENKEEEEKILECLQPHFGLKELEIQQYGGSILPTWISKPSFSNLLTITLYRCKNCKLLPAIGQLPELKFLSIIEMNELKEINDQFFRNGSVDQQSPAFPKLEELEVDIMLNLKDWMEVEKGDLQSLLKLTVDSCPELVSLPSLSELKSLKHVEFKRCPKLLPLPQDGLPTSVESFIIIGCPGLKEWCQKGRCQASDNIHHVRRIWFDCEEISKKK